VNSHPHGRPVVGYVRSPRLNDPELDGLEAKHLVGGVRRRVAWGAADPLWVTLRRPHRPLAYPAMRAVLIRANKVQGTN
jgi:hypothetical protein